MKREIDLKTMANFSKKSTDHDDPLIQIEVADPRTVTWCLVAISGPHPTWKLLKPRYSAVWRLGVPIKIGICDKKSLQTNPISKGSFFSGAAIPDKKPYRCLSGAPVFRGLEDQEQAVSPWETGIHGLLCVYTSIYIQYNMYGPIHTYITVRINILCIYICI